MFDIVASDFDVVPFALPNLDKAPNSFANFVDANIEEQLRKVLGDFFYDAFINGLALLPAWVQKVSPAGYAIGAQVSIGNDVWESLTADNVALIVEGINWHKVEINNRWLVLKNGADYTYNSFPRKWVGMHKMLVPMIYSLYTAANVKQQTSLGIVVANSENSEVVSAGDNIVRGWNKYADFICGSERWGFYRGMFMGLHGYLYSVKADFDDLFAVNAYKTMQVYLDTEFCPPVPQNVFDL